MKRKIIRLIQIIGGIVLICMGTYGMLGKQRLNKLKGDK